MEAPDETSDESSPPLRQSERHRDAPGVDYARLNSGSVSKGTAKGAEKKSQSLEVSPRTRRSTRIIANQINQNSTKVNTPRRTKTATAEKRAKGKRGVAAGKKKDDRKGGGEAKKTGDIIEDTKEDIIETNAMEKVDDNNGSEGGGDNGGDGDGDGEGDGDGDDGNGGGDDDGDSEGGGEGHGDGASGGDEEEEKDCDDVAQERPSEIADACRAASDGSPTKGVNLFQVKKGVQMILSPNKLSAGKKTWQVLSADENTEAVAACIHRIHEYMMTSDDYGETKSSMENNHTGTRYVDHDMAGLKVLNANVETLVESRGSDDFGLVETSGDSLGMRSTTMFREVLATKVSPFALFVLTHSEYEEPCSPGVNHRCVQQQYMTEDNPFVKAFLEDASVGKSTARVFESSPMQFLPYAIEMESDGFLDIPIKSTAQVIFSDSLGEPVRMHIKKIIARRVTPDDMANLAQAVGATQLKYCADSALVDWDDLLSPFRLEGLGVTVSALNILCNRLGWNIRFHGEIGLCNMEFRRIFQLMTPVRLACLEGNHRCYVASKIFCDVKPNDPIPCSTRGEMNVTAKSTLCRLMTMNVLAPTNKCLDTSTLENCLQLSREIQSAKEKSIPPSLTEFWNRVAENIVKETERIFSPRVRNMTMEGMCSYPFIDEIPECEWSQYVDTIRRTVITTYFNHRISRVELEKYRISKDDAASMCKNLLKPPKKKRDVNTGRAYEAIVTGFAKKGFPPKYDMKDMPLKNLVDEAGSLVVLHITLWLFCNAYILRESRESLQLLLSEKFKPIHDEVAVGDFLILPVNTIVKAVKEGNQGLFAKLKGLQGNKAGKVKIKARMVLNSLLFTELVTGFSDHFDKISHEASTNDDIYTIKRKSLPLYRAYNENKLEQHKVVDDFKASILLFVDHVSHPDRIKRSFSLQNCYVTESGVILPSSQQVEESAPVEESEVPLEKSSSFWKKEPCTFPWFWKRTSFIDFSKKILRPLGETRFPGFTETYASYLLGSQAPKKRKATKQEPAEEPPSKKTKSMAGPSNEQVAAMKGCVKSIRAIVPELTTGLEPDKKKILGKLFEELNEVFGIMGYTDKVVVAGSEDNDDGNVDDNLERALGVPLLPL